MPDPDGYEYWPVQHTLKFPVGDPEVDAGFQSYSLARCKLEFPRLIPFDRSIAERSVATAHSWAFTFAVRSQRTGDGAIDSHLRCVGKHVHWWEDHGENAVGPEVTVSIPEAKIRQLRFDSLHERAAHGPHRDLIALDYRLTEAGILDIVISGSHSQLVGEAETPFELPPLPPVPGPPPPPPKPPSDPGFPMRGRRRGRTGG